MSGRVDRRGEGSASGLPRGHGTPGEGKHQPFVVAAERVPVALQLGEQRRAPHTYMYEYMQRTRVGGRQPVKTRARVDLMRNFNAPPKIVATSNGG